jgi:hypothetical protein
MPPRSDIDAAFAAAVDRVRNGERGRFTVEVEDEYGTPNRIESEPWGMGCLTYASVQDLELASDSERLGASVFRYVCGHAECHWRHLRTAWVRDPAVAVPPREFGISVMLFYYSEGPVSPM